LYEGREEKQSVIGRLVHTNRSFLCLYYTTAVSFCRRKTLEKELRAVEGEIEGKEQKHRHHIFPINGWPFSS